MVVDEAATGFLIVIFNLILAEKLKGVGNNLLPFSFHETNQADSAYYSKLRNLSNTLYV